MDPLVLQITRADQEQIERLREIDDSRPISDPNTGAAIAWHEGRIEAVEGRLLPRAEGS